MGALTNPDDTVIQMAPVNFNFQAIDVREVANHFKIRSGTGRRWI
jgi:hypothetical protein